MNIEQINEKLLKLVVNERKITNEILQYIAEFYKFNGPAKWVTLRLFSISQKH